MEYFQQFAAVAGVLIVLVTGLGWLRRRGWVARLPKRKRELECLERLALGPQHSLHLVKARGRLMLVSASPAGCTVLGQMGEGAVTVGGPESQEAAR
jgi:flagellar biogenesis protein FliO